MAKVKKKNPKQLTISIVVGDVRALGILYTSGGNVKLFSHFKTVFQFFTHLNIHLSYDSSIPLLDIYPPKKVYV